MQRTSDAAQDEPASPAPPIRPESDAGSDPPPTAAPDPPPTPADPPPPAPAAPDQPPPAPADPDPSVLCGPGTALDEDGVCQIVGGAAQAPTAPEGGGCLVATAAYGTELAPQVQALRELRDAAVQGTDSGAVLMVWLNGAYYAVSPAVADLERQSPAFRHAVLAALTPVIAPLAHMGHAVLPS